MVTLPTTITVRTEVKNLLRVVNAHANKYYNDTIIELYLKELRENYRLTNKQIDELKKNVNLN